MEITFDSSGKVTGMNRAKMDGELSMTIDQSQLVYGLDIEKYTVQNGNLVPVDSNKLQEIENKRIIETNKYKALAAQDEIIEQIMESEDRKTNGLPPKYSENQISHMRDQLQSLQNFVENPSNDSSWQPPFPALAPSWDSSTQYHIGDVVYHNGSMWQATSNNSNNEPDDVPGDWEQME